MALENDPQKYVLPAGSIEVPAAGAANTPAADTLELSGVKKILEFSGLDAAQQQQVLGSDDVKNKHVFSGQEAVKMGLLTQDKLESALTEQSNQKITAAVDDYKTIQKAVTDATPPKLPENPGNLQPNFNNNKPVQNPTKVDALSAVANETQNLTLMAYNDYALTQDHTITEAMQSAKNLQTELNSPNPVDKDKVKQDLANLDKGLIAAADDIKMAPADRKKMDDFLTARASDVVNGMDKPATQQQVIQAPAPAPEAKHHQPATPDNQLPKNDVSPKEPVAVGGGNKAPDEQPKHHEHAHHHSHDPEPPHPLARLINDEMKENLRNPKITSDALDRPNDGPTPTWHAPQNEHGGGRTK